ncbi:fibronectin type III domain-containing protein [Micromonospora sp. WMMD980]|uniref:fibronectin type III domain-containing protein n=1 Tax=Micromonospora sp. WMMD980 TaxID=3016088 RepID=UPI002417746D|nr:fibronectin type III domain-containing protein [Micromonospora sp. WMMD980]MDG4799918.1 fibronectin type III domain-containing protein [Micromonospora sp. WMMD980]
MSGPGAYPVSAAPVSGHPPPPVSGPPAAPVSGTPVPPWGLTAPPWSSVAPPQPVDGPAGAGPDPAADAYAPGPVEEPGSAGDGGVGRDGGVAQDPPVEGGPLPVYDGLLDFPESTRPEPAAYPEQGSWPAVPQAFHQPAAYPDTAERESGGRNRTVLALVVGGAVLAVVAAVVGGAVWLNRDAAPPAPAPTAVKPKVTGPPPGDLRLRDDTTTITVTWTDPTNGGVPFVVAGGRAGQKLGVMATVDAGQTRYTVNGLKAKLDYCFTVLAVYSTDTYATSGQACTDREGGGTPN